MKLSINGRQAAALKRNLDLLARNAQDREKFFRRAGAYMQHMAVKNFSNESSPDGKRWKKLKPETLAARRRGDRARGGTRILQVTGDLKNSIGIIEIWKDGVRVGPALGVFQGIGRAHEFGRPEINLPARPFLGITSEMEKHMTNDLVHQLFEGVKSG